MHGDEEWVDLHEAARTASVPVTTIRDWYRSGTIQSISDDGGRRLVLMSEVQREATGMDPARRRAARPVRSPEDLEAEVESIAARTKAVNDLQDIARRRLEDPPPE
jgi:predicted site-specific integrase-resolvase